MSFAPPSDSLPSPQGAPATVGSTVNRAASPHRLPLKLVSVSSLDRQPSPQGEPSTGDNNAPRCYLVTGAAGFIASKVCEQLLEAGHTVVGVDNLNDYYDVRLKAYRLSRLMGADAPGGGKPEGGNLKPENLVPPGQSHLGGLPPGMASLILQVSGLRPQVSSLSSGRFIFHALDIENLPALENLFSEHRFSAVFNLAGRAGVRYSMEHPHVYLSTNTLGTLNLLECQRKYGVRKHVLASSSSLYAGCPLPFTEDQPVNTPQSPYAATKKAAELMAYTYHRLYGLDVSVLRYFTVFGPAGRPDMAPLRFIKWIDEGTPITLYGDGTQSRDFTYVDDIARGTVLAAAEFGAAPNPVDSARSALRSDGEEPSTAHRSSSTGSPVHRPPSTGFEILNLGGGRHPTTLNEVIALIETALGKKAVINRQPLHRADVLETSADITKARRLLGWQPEISPEEGFRRTVEWHIANREWMRSVSV